MRPLCIRSCRDPLADVARASASRCHRSDVNDDARRRAPATTFITSCRRACVCRCVSLPAVAETAYDEVTIRRSASHSAASAAASVSKPASATGGAEKLYQSAAEGSMSKGSSALARCRRRSGAARVWFSARSVRIWKCSDQIITISGASAHCSEPVWGYTRRRAPSTEQRAPAGLTLPRSRGGALQRGLERGGDDAPRRGVYIDRYIHFCMISIETRQIVFANTSSGASTSALG